MNRSSKTTVAVDVDANNMLTPHPLLTASEAAALCRVACRTWRTWHSTGKIPQPIRIGRKIFWRPEELRAWIATGCPDREMWEVIRK